MGEPVRDERSPDVAALEAEIVRLNKVVDALMDRVEASANAQGSDFGLFQTTIMLQDQVRMHAAELEASLGEQEHDERDARDAGAGDMQTLRRTAALQIQLLELVVQKKDVAELVDTVATLLDMPIVLFDTRGRAVCSSRSAERAPGLAKRLWATYRDLQNVPGRLGIVEDAGDRVFYRDILVMDRVDRVLAAVASQQQPADLAGASLSFLQQLVTLDLLRSRDELRMRRRVRRGLLRDILAGDGSPEELRIRMQEQGFAAADTLRIAVVEPGPASAARDEASAAARASQPSGTRLLQAMDAAVSKRRMPFLSASVSRTAVVLVTLPDERTDTARALIADLQDTAARVASSGKVVVGCSAPFTGLAGAARSLQQARAACVAARRGPSSDGTAVFEDLSGHLRLLDGLDHAALEDIVRRTFGPLLRYDAEHRASLYDTLHALFEHQRAVQETADALHIHRNSLQKRLAHVEQLLGIDLDDLDDVVDVQLGLRAADLLDRRLP